ncbi:type II secretion system protein XpsN [Luteimonas sp. RIT-PG2_3]|jgi:general secretion pathway protein N
MRVDASAAKTWLYAAIAGWAVLVWALSLFGMGGRINRLQDDPSQRQSLPAMPAAATERLGPLQQYAEIGARPMFTNDRRPQPFLINADAAMEQGGGFDFVLTSVLKTPGLDMVILTPADGSLPARVKVGGAPDSAPGWVLDSVSARSAVFNGPDGPRTLELRNFDGTGGQAPTAISRPAPMAGMPPGQGGPAPSVATPMPVQAMPPPSATDGGPPAAVVPAPGQDAEAAMSVDPARSTEEQVEAIRKRIEARRAKLRQDASANPQNKTP